MSELSDNEWCHYSGMPSPKAYAIEPLSKEILLERGHCCDNGCKNCPYKTEHITENDEWVDSDNDDYDGYSSSKIDGGELYGDDDSNEY